MRWSKSFNFVIVIILSIIYTVVTLLNIMGPLHMNATGAITKPGLLSIYSIIFWLFSLLMTWLVYFLLRNKSEALFFILIILGIVLIIAENFLWAWMG